MNDKIKVLTVLLLTIVMAVAFAGCSKTGASVDDSSAGGTTETQSVDQNGTEAATDNTEEATADEDYNIASVVNESLKNCLPEDVDYTIQQVDSNCLEVILKAASEAGLGGVAGDIMAFDEGSEEYKDFPDYKEIGTKDGKVYILLRPTDIQFDMSDSQQQEDYSKLLDALETLTIQ